MYECIAPHEIREGDLLTYLEGEASPTLAQHIAHCHFCTAEVVALQRVTGLFAGALFRASCPEVDELLQYQARLLTGASRQRIERHLAACSLCQDEVQQLAQAAPLTTLTGRAASLVHSLKEAGKEIWEAVLLTGMPRSVPALRGINQPSVVYQAGAYQLILVKIPPIAGEKVWQIEGQLVHQAGPASHFNGRVWLQQGGQSVASDVVDDFGYFALEQVASGNYSLSIELGSVVIVLADLAVP